MSWENEDYVPNRPIKKDNPSKNLRSLTQTSKDPLARLPYGPDTNVLSFLTGEKIKAVKNTPAKLLFSQKLSKMLPKGQTQRRRNLLRKENEEALEPFFRQLEQERQERLNARKRSAEKAAFNTLIREGTTLPTSSHLRAKASQNRKKAREKSRRRRGHSTSHKTQKRGR
jgi:hypothetical protein